MLFYQRNVNMATISHKGHAANKKKALQAKTKRCKQKGNAANKKTRTAELLLKSLLNFTIFSAPFRRSSSAPIDGNTLSSNVDPRITFSYSSFNLIRPICMVTSLSLFSFFAFFTDLLLTNLELHSFSFFLYTRQR